ncbi:MAG: alcohol dehydrogenase, partial [Mycobacterium sp.]
EETLHFALLSGVRALIEERPLAQAAEAYAAMDTGRARYRMVLTV